MKCRSETQETEKQQTGQESGKDSSYKKPELRKFGELHALIRGSGGSGDDDGGQSYTVDPE